MVKGREGQPISGDARLSSLAGEARLAYLPVVDLGSGQLLGFEALMRWHHPTEGIISPHLLIPWAEANGDIIELGEWVLVEGCRHATAWPSSMQLAANCSIVQLRNGAGSRAVARALETSGLSPDRLTVEVTEHAMSDEAAVADLLLIVDQGVQLAVDDVGTSWNSFELLRRLAVNTVKIDQSFVSGLEEHEGINRMVVETLVHLAHNGGMSTVAEGVETELQAKLVREFESDAAQGYYFAPPLDEVNATRMANMTDLRFPLEGPGWHNDDWPFEGASINEDGSAVSGEVSEPAGAIGGAEPAEGAEPAKGTRGGKGAKGTKRAQHAGGDGEAHAPEQVETPGSSELG